MLMTDRVGEENEGFRMIRHGMNGERILIGAGALGLGFAALRRPHCTLGSERCLVALLARIRVNDTPWSRVG